MPLLAPIAPFLALIDRLISLIKRRETREREYFEKIIEPLYVQFKPLGEDYLKIFHEAQNSIKESKRPSNIAVSHIRKKRQNLAATRTQLRALLAVCEKQASKKHHDDLADFVRAMAGFFDSSFGRKTIPTTHTMELVTLFEEWHKNGPDGYVEDCFDKIVFQLDRMWYEISGRYMELKIKSVGE